MQFLFMADWTESFNRTTVELKFNSSDYTGSGLERFNRTTVELKYVLIKEIEYRDSVLIALQ